MLFTEHTLEVLNILLPDTRLFFTSHTKRKTAQKGNTAARGACHNTRSERFESKLVEPKQTRHKFGSKRSRSISVCGSGAADGARN